MIDNKRHWNGQSRHVLAIAAWLTLFWVAVGFVLSVPSIAARVSGPDAPPAWQVTGRMAALSAGITLLVLWISALWHAATDERKRGVPKPVLLVVMVIGNACAAFFYYFLYVFWRSEGKK